MARALACPDCGGRAVLLLSDTPKGEPPRWPVECADERCNRLWFSLHCAVRLAVAQTHARTHYPSPIPPERGTP